MATASNTTTLSLGIVARSQYAPLKDGRVTLAGYVLDCLEVAPMPRLFDRMIKNLEFDVSEMAIVTYLQGKEIGKPLTALPIFPLRAFPHGAIQYNVDSGIQSPYDLAGRKVGVRAYAGTAGVWARGLLQSEHGVDPGSITWILNDNEHLDECPNPSNTRLIKGANLGEMLIAGEIDAAIGLQNVDAPNLKTLISSPRQKQAEWYGRTGIFPINNTVVVKDELLAADPGLALALFNAFKEAKALYLQDLKANGAQAKDAEADLRFMEIVGEDPLPVGIDANRTAIETVVQYSIDQGIISERFSIEQLFAASTLSLS
ncbi:MAG: ABC transporter substrate-binding protein [Chloroflexota bacterium]